MSTTNTISFFWKAKFTDGFELAQFNNDGTENMIHQFLTPALIARRNAGLTIIGKNVFASLENDHGLMVKFGWHPFDHTLANAVRNTNPDYMIAELNEDPTEIDIPADSYANFFRTSIATYGKAGELPNKEDHSLAIGLIKRADENSHIHFTKYDSDDNVVEEKLDKSFDRKDKTIGKKIN